jgi:hypothetical protein
MENSIKVIIEVPICDGTTKERAEYFVKEFVRHNFQKYIDAKISVEEIKNEK